MWLQYCCLGNREEQVLSCDKASTDLYSEELTRLLPSLWPSGKSHLNCLVFATAGDHPPDMGAQESWYFLKWVCHRPCDHGAFSHCYLHSSSEQVSSETDFWAARPGLSLRIRVPCSPVALYGIASVLKGTIQFIWTTISWERREIEVERRWNLTSQGMSRRDYEKQCFADIPSDWLCCSVGWFCFGAYDLSSLEPQVALRKPMCGSGSFYLTSQAMFAFRRF